MLHTSPLPLRSGHIYMKDAHCAEPNEKSFIRFFRFYFIFRVMADCIYNLLVRHLNFHVCRRPKKNSLKSG